MTGEKENMGFTFIVESVDSVCAGTLVVATENEKVLGILDLVGEQEADDLKGLLAAVDIVAQEEIVGLGREATVFEQAEQIVVLAVDVTTDLDGCLQLEEDGLGDEDLSGGSAQELDLVLGELDLLARS